MEARGWGKTMKLWYEQPAADWKQGLPIGNGRLGAVVYGGSADETWCMTESTYWSGKRERTTGRADGPSLLEQARSHFFSGEYEQGEELAKQFLQPEKGNYGTHLPMCDIKLSFGKPGEAFTRELDLEEAIVRISYRSEGTDFIREIFATHADGIVASRILSERAGGVSFTLGIEGRTEHFAASVQRHGTIAFSGRATERVHSDGECGVSCRGMVRIETRGGAIEADELGLRVVGADEAIIYYAAATDYDRSGGEWGDEPRLQLERAAAKGYSRLREDHVADYRRLYGRVELRLGKSDGSSLPTDDRIRQLRNGEREDPQLFALFYQYARYLMIAGSRENSPLPMNLQGIWNDGEANRMAWSCDYHLDINTQMNYYPAETGNLGECHLPLLRFVERLSEDGREAASDFYGCEGWVAHVFTNAWGFSAPGWHYSWGLNVTGGLWIATQLREHYEFGLDPEFLTNLAYPVLKEAAVFFLEYMTVHPKHGWLVTGPSNSPENSFYPGNRAADGEHHLSMGPTMDQALVRDLFTFCLESAERLGRDTELQRKLKEAIALLPPLTIGKGGQLQEWLEDYGEAQPDHRHLSHLYALYPGNQVTPDGTPNLAAAARTTLEARRRAGKLEDVEFTLALFSAGFARLRDGEQARDNLAYLIGQLSFDNLLTYSKPGIAGAETNIFVVDGNFGGAAALAEMLLQSHAGAIHLLPALPAGWAAGSFSGLRARGNAEVDAVWEDGILISAEIRAFSTGRTLLRYRDRIVPLELAPGAVYAVDRELRATEISGIDRS